MAHGTQLSARIGDGDILNDYDLAAGGAYLTTGKVQSFVLFASPNGTTAPTPFVTGQKTAANSLGVVLASDQPAVPVSASSLPLPTGAATAALQSTLIGHIDGVEALLTTLAGAVAGSEVQVDVLTLPALPAGDNNIGNVDIASMPADPLGLNADAASATGSISAKMRHLAAVGLAGMTSLPAGTNNIGDVDVLSVPADPFGANADAAASAGGTGSISAKLRRLSTDLATLLLQTDTLETLLGGGLPAALVGGRLDVRVGAFGDSLPAGTANIGDVDVLTLPADPLGLNADAASATGSIAAKLRHLAAVGIAGMTALPAGTNNIGDIDVLSVPADPFGANGDAASATGSISAKLRFIAATGIPITGSVTIVGAAAHDSPVSGNPALVGGEARTTNPTAVADGDAVRSMHDKLGRQVVAIGQARELLTHATTTITASTSETTVLAAGASGVFHDIVSVFVANTSATAVRVDFKDATSGTIRFSIYAPAGQVTGFCPSRPVTQASAANNWTATSSASVTDLRIFVQAEKNL